MTVHRLFPQGGPINFQQKLAAARTEAEVVDIARDFIATVSADEVAYLPEPLRPRKIVDAEDITTYGFQLVRMDCEDLGGAEQLVHRLANFFSTASIRLSEIMVREHAGQEDDQRSA